MIGALARFTANQDSSFQPMPKRLKQPSQIERADSDSDDEDAA
jgi:hypothetical protein